ncbi:MAG: DUF2442 domain-containing protein [Nitrospirae bacterium]|nr:MAG: DUF2442 domain-containing protein [Nitrospirota bacterium]
MTSKTFGENTSEVEVSNISRHGCWILIKSRELFIPFKEFPWLKGASAGAILNAQLPSPHHLYWLDLDVDLAVESIEHPERFPFISKVVPNKPMEGTH